MDGLYSGIEASLLALMLAIGLAVAATASLPSAGRGVVIATTLPMISVTAGEPAE